MKIFIGILLIASCLPYFITADSAAAAAAAASSSNDEAASAAAATAATGGGSSSAAAAAASSSLKPHTIKCPCPSKYAPVCGTNGRTYSNVCILNCVNKYHSNHKHRPIKVKSQGHCPPPSCKCPKIWSPVCASNNVTFGNDCELKCENARRNPKNQLTVMHKGECKAPVCICSDAIIPVCGNDNITYRNICIMQCMSHINKRKGRPGIEFKSAGACAKEACPRCSTTRDEVCGSDGNTYLNECLLKCQNRRRENMGLPPLTHKKGPCPCICPTVVDPVCASDGNTYKNPCHLKCENDKRIREGKSVLTSKKGVCCTCTGPYKPLCNSDYRTNSNKCALKCENKARKLKGLPPLTVLFNGKCVCTDCRKCHSKYEPVCGSDYNTYWNLCWMNCNITCRPWLWIRWYGKC